MAKPSGGAPSHGRPLLDATMSFFIGLAIAAALLVLALKGWGALRVALGHALTIIATVAPSIAVGLYLGGLAVQLADPKRIAPVLGAQSGWLGLLLATGLGSITPGGPFAAFPIVYALFLAGADIGAVVAYVTAWSVVGLHRVVVWELPLLGFDFTTARVVAGLPLPILAGALARLIARGRLAVMAPGHSAGVQGKRAP
jgi:uncharacterized membrane protein YraQ (UPF0718 family)